jgi:nucleotide-binding universal stress UspA family protein
LSARKNDGAQAPVREKIIMKILLPVDGSELSLEAVRFALRLLGDGLQGSAVLANVQEPASLYEMLVSHDPEMINEVSAQAGLHALSQAQALLTDAGVVFETEVAKGDPAHTIADIVERFGCDLVVMGARGQSALRSAMMGSVSNEVLHASAVPVVIVKAPETPAAE